MLQQATVNQMASDLFQALQTNTQIAPLKKQWSEMTVNDAYAISMQMLALRTQNKGEKVTGKKVGVTSAVAQEFMGVSQPDFGFLTDAMVYQDGAEINLASTLIQPRIEAEIAFILSRDLRGPGVTEHDVLAATDAIAPCFEIVDSRIKDWRIKIEDTIADNASCGAYVLSGARACPKEHDLSQLHVALRKNGNTISQGHSSIVLGNPLTAVAWLANMLAHFGHQLRCGEVVLSGSIVTPVTIVAGDLMEMTLGGVGNATIKLT
jgi:2-oxopent-4-enoate/cis-2-oxohex-4-enoate hydratase